ncbi:MAG: tetratricopeptide repeat protein [Proteobacteria bacterium]|jgi:TolA-binding protein|nr:tetratricopeptide repeat protein [Pseudomonadota bacterium]
MKILSLVLPLLLIGCAPFLKKEGSHKVAVVKSPAVMRMEQQRKIAAEQRQTQKDTEQLLSKKGKLKSAGFLQAVSAQPQRKAAVVEVQPRLAKMDEKNLYSELMTKFDQNDEFGFQSRYQAFKTVYPKSALMDDVIYTSGLLRLANKNYGQALVEFNSVLKKYPRSNRAVSSQFAKGVVLKRMNLKDQAINSFQLVKKSYPGSPEALRAENELKIMLVR